jgi:serine protease Do
MEDAPSGPRPYLGASIEQIDGKTKVENTTKDSPADKAGLKSGDIILTCEGKKVANATALADHVKSHKPGDKLGLKVLRDEKEVEIEITLGEKK